MSVRAYKLIKIDHDTAPTFNCWNDEKIMRLFDTDDFTENGGIITTTLKQIQSELDEAEAQKNKTNEDKEYIKTLKQIIKDFGDEDFIQYYCF